ncbi:MAG TPA: VanZ family protein [Flavobacteriaceae bacterium]|nr:VanZ family protein [Flavobacteriaceae bacterium]
MICSQMRSIKSLLESKILFSIALGYTIFITILFFIPTSGLPKVEVSGFDKWIHILLFACLSFIWCLFFSMRGNLDSWKSMLLLGASFIAYGILIEVFQEIFTTSRAADFYDVLADIAGIILGMSVFQGIKSKVTKMAI